MTLPGMLKLNDARKYKNEMFASLSALEVEILDTVTKSGMCFGSRPGSAKTESAVLTAPGHKSTKVLEGGQATLNAMVRAGWLRFAPMPTTTEGSGYFWATASSERLWQVLGRCN